MNILITGIHGFVGSNFVSVFEQSHVLYGLDIVAPEREGVKRTFSWKELEDDKLPDMDVIIHLAGKAHDTKNQALAQSYFDINTGLTQKVFDYFLKSSATKFIFFSSVKAAADKVAGGVLTENIVPKPKGPYGESKIAAENYILSKLKIKNEKSELCDADKQVYILRPCMIHGAGNKGNLNLLYSVVRRGIPWPLGAFDNRRSFTSIDNLTFIVQHLLDKKVESGIYHIGDDDPLSTNELIGLIAEAVGKKRRIWCVNKGMITGLAKIGDWFHLPLNTERLQKLTENYVVSNQKIKRAIGVSRLPMTAEEGMKKTIQSFQ